MIKAPSVPILLGKHSFRHSYHFRKRAQKCMSKFTHGTIVEMPWLHELIVGGTSRALTIDGSQPRSIVAAPLWWPSTSPQEKY